MTKSSSDWEPVCYGVDTDTMAIELRPWPGQPGEAGEGEDAGPDLVIHYYPGDGKPWLWEIEHASQHPEHIAAALREMRVGQPKRHTLNALEGRAMGQGPTAAYYRKVAAQMRDLARRGQLREVRNEMADLAARLARMGEYFERMRVELPPREPPAASGPAKRPSASAAHDRPAEPRAAPASPKSPKSLLDRSGGQAC